MAFCSVCKFLRRGKYFVLLLLVLSVLAWIATFAGETMKSVQVSPTTVQTVHKGETLEGELNSLRSVTDLQNTPAPKVKCPEESPLLQGALKLSFESSLTLKDVEQENKAVAEGQYRPPDCTARQSVAILIPHRNREKHLLYLLHHLHPFLQRQQLHYSIYVIQQAGDATFNRAKLLNVGYLEALKDYNWECFIFHDVDLVPENDYNLYICDKQPKHLVVGRNATGYKLRYKGYFGGVTAMTKDQFHKVNGFSNIYWGWGGEDDDLRIRVELQKMKIVRPPPDVARYTMVFHKRDSGNEINKDRMRLLGRTPQVWRKDGLKNCLYKTLSIERLPLYVNVTVDIGKPQAS
ncbi:beta-1,4-galactosyltransferase 4 [Myripristis murdjan]|uniref:Beta-1,4-galactosyltransferase n=1 Tax=Myripristis murdjan TaxID=586833 RepID=A0A667XKP8_9TELE|nr:beta-1,4-galactosyltransferase 4 [Myripristis murdjan]XP_029925322.1 beta-1,4-galactosyltransferase 4 [Myripristis murdjan]XP_029925323.1 beta-1,4-galactosyltransferase 4 [Myripristis murdjan]XP_029925324.1 beta-1,4-galactosyltransferase 4 [Myripristis murdjan]